MTGTDCRRQDAPWGGSGNRDEPCAPMVRRLLPSFDGTENCHGEYCRPDRYGELFRVCAAPGPRMARGAGLSYCGAGAAPTGCTISMLRFNRVLEFDAAHGRITVEPGLSVGELFRFLRSREMEFPVLPGYPSITVGGCVAFNVHGKSQHHAGCFGEHVEALRLFHPQYGELQCSGTENSGVFRLTIGGMGFTGVITEVTLRIRPLRGASVRLTTSPVRNLADAVARMEERAADTDVLYSWNDLNRAGDSFGAGFVFFEHLLPDSRSGQLRRAGLRPENRGVLRGSLYNRTTARWMCRLFSVGKALTAGERTLSHEQTAFPISGKEIYFLLFGRRGLREYQMLIPRANWDTFAAELAEIIGHSRVPLTLGSLKLFSGTSALLHFNGSGVCLALDVPAVDPALKLFEELDELVIRSGGCANLSKDSRLQAATVARMFAGYEEFRNELRAFDPSARFQSALRSRLAV